jgi:general stress protein 26
MPAERDRRPREGRVVSIAHPWLETHPWPTQKLPRDQLARRIERALTLTNIGVLATLGKDGPIASPVEFYAQGLCVYVFPQPRSPKVRAIERDPRVCFAVANPMAGWASAQGAQLFGRARLLDPGTPEWQHGMQVYRWQSSAIEVRGRADSPPNGQLLMLDPDRVVYTEHWLRRDGYAPRQIWTRAETPD